jgi:hypothetical protein
MDGKTLLMDKLFINTDIHDTHLQIEELLYIMGFFSSNLSVQKNNYFA